MIEYVFKILQLDTTVKNDIENVVYCIRTHLSGTDGVATGNTYFGVAIPFNPESTFVTYQELTEEQCISWVLTNVSQHQLTNYQNIISKQIEDQHNPVITLPLPWGSSS